MKHTLRVTSLFLPCLLFGQQSINQTTPVPGGPACCLFGAVDVVALTVPTSDGRKVARINVPTGEYFVNWINTQTLEKAPVVNYVYGPGTYSMEAPDKNWDYIVQLRPNNVNPRPSPLAFYRAINLGGPNLIIDGHRWEGRDTKDYAYDGDEGCVQPAFTVTPKIDDNKAQMYRCFIYDFWGTNVVVQNVPAGIYQVVIHTFEDSLTPVHAEGTVNGRVVQIDSGAQGEHRAFPFEHVVVGIDGLITFRTATKVNDDGSRDALAVSGIEIYREVQ